MTIGLNVANRIAAVTGTPCVVCGNSDYTVQVSCDAEWAAYSQKTLQIAYLCGGRTVHASAAVTNGAAVLPVISGASEILIGLQAGEIRTAAPARIRCAACICDIPAEQATAAHDIYNETMQALAALMPHQVIRLLRDCDGFVLRSSNGKLLRVKGGTA